MNGQRLRLRNLMAMLIDADERISLWINDEPAVSGKCSMLLNALNDNILNASVVSIGCSIPDTLLIKTEEDDDENA